jgi:hypothetical protein
MNLNQKKLVQFFIILIIGTFLMVNGCVNNKKEFEVKGTRSFFLGITPTPKSVPETTFNDLINAFKEASEIAEIAMVWTNTNIGQTKKLKENNLITALRNYGLKPVITLNFTTIKKIPGKGLQQVIDAPEGINPSLSDLNFRNAWLIEAKNLAKEFKPEYFSLGNEINDYFFVHPEELKDFLTLFDEAKTQIKKVSPNTKVFIVFSFNHLIDNNQWELLEKFDDRVDLIGLTTYPWKHFNDPEDIPENYYSKLKNFTSKPIAFTEIGWISAKEKQSSEEEQARFLKRFLKLTKNLKIEMINWLFLHETKLSGISALISEPETSTIALKKADSTKKKVYEEWLKIKKLKIER